MLKYYNFLINKYTLLVYAVLQKDEHEFMQQNLKCMIQHA